MFCNNQKDSITMALNVWCSLQTLLSIQEQSLQRCIDVKLNNAGTAVWLYQGLRRAGRKIMFGGRSISRLCLF
jgi:hypothetical protein